MAGDVEFDTDVVVVGGGGCGMVAALAAVREGVDVVLVEKSDRLGGNTALSGGSIPGAGTRLQKAAGVEDSPAKMAEDILRQNGYTSDRRLTEVLCERSADLVEWLMDDIGLNLTLITHYKHVGHSVNRLHAAPSRQGRDVVKDLAAAVEHEGVVVATSSPVTSLLTTAEGAVCGVQVDRGDGEIETIRAKKVILATNGFGGNRKMIRTYCPDIADAPYYGHPGNTGEGIVWGMRLGAEVRSMGAYQGYAAVAYPHGTLFSWTVLEMGGILVNKAGRRFGNESLGYSAYTRFVLRQEGQLAYAVFDERIRDYVAQGEREFRDLIARGGVQTAQTLSELAKLFDIDANALEATVAEFNGDPEEDPFGRRDRAMAPLRPPYCVGRVTGGLFHTQGGLRVDEHARPVRQDGSVVENLYAGGGVAAGFSGDDDGAGYASGNGLFAALGLGRLAGEHAARSIREEEAS